MFGLQVGGKDFELFLLIFSVLILFSVISSRASRFLGVPSLLLFLGVGMLAGSDGIGKIAFTNYPLALVIGSISLIFIIFDGGMRTDWKKTQPILKTGISYSTLGVLFTCLFVGIFVHYAFHIPLLESFLLGAIISSTDAAAVFSILRSKNLSLKGSTKELLEFEAGSNDPAAIFLTIGLLSLVTNSSSGMTDFITLFVTQIFFGGLFGLLGGKITIFFLNKIKVDYDGLYAVLLVSIVMMIFSTTSALNGSGFLAVYVAGVIIGNSNILRKYSLLVFQDGIAWLAQILLFLVLGLLVFPTHLLEVWKEGVFLTVFMMFIARPLSVYLANPFAKLTLKERAFISWVGLRGAAPIILAILPWIANYPQAEYYFNLVFFVVLLSVFLQGTTISWLANKLHLTEVADEEGSYNPTFLPKGFVTLDLVITRDAYAAEKRIIDLKLPPGVLLISLKRDGRFVVPQGDTTLLSGDTIMALGRRSNLQALQELFGYGKINY